MKKPSEAKTKKGNKRKPKFVNLDCLEVPYGTLTKVYKVPERRIPDAIDELLAKGFIRYITAGQLNTINQNMLWLIIICCGTQAKCRLRQDRKENAEAIKGGISKRKIPKPR